MRSDVVLREEHRPALRRREAVAVDVADVHVRGPRREALLEDLEALVDEREEQPLDDLIGLAYAVSAKAREVCERDTCKSNRGFAFSIAYGFPM